MPKKVLLISNKVYHYRVSIYNFFYDRFLEHDYEFQVLTNELQQSYEHNHAFRLKVMPFNFKSYQNEINEIKPDVIILFLHLKDKVIWPLAHWLKMKGIPFIYWTHGVNLQDPNNFFKNILFRYLHTLSDGIILYSPTELKYISSGNQKKTFIALNTLNFNEFPEINSSKSELRKEFNIPFSKIVLFAARADPRRKLDWLVDVFKGNTDPSIGLVIAGADDLPDDIAQEVSQNDSIISLGQIPDQEKFNKVVKMADVFCIPGKSGLAINQAFFWGVPYITTNVKQSPEVWYIKHGKNGYVLDKDDFPSFKEKLIELLKKEDLQKEFAINAKETIEEFGTINNMFQGFLQAVNFVKGEANT